MARLPRLALTGVPHCVILLGNNLQPVFQDAADRTLFLELLAEHAQREQVQVHAYVLLDNQVHVLLTPQKEGGLTRMMQAVGRAYVRRFNLRHGRSGTLWGGRYRCTVLDPDRYLLLCMVCLDTAPVRAGLVHAADLHPWSSHAHYTGRRPERWLTPHPLVWALGNTPFAREAAYAALVQQGVPEALCQRLTAAALKGWVLGEGSFLEVLREQTGRRLEKSQPGRPTQGGVHRP